MRKMGECEKCAKLPYKWITASWREECRKRIEKMEKISTTQWQSEKKQQQQQQQ